METKIQILPEEILNRNKQREGKKNFIKAIFLDIFLVFYSLLVLHRIIYLRFFLNLKDIPFSWNQVAVLFIISIVAGVSWASTKTSLSCKLFGIAKQNRTTKWTTEIFGWFLFDITFIAGWVVTKISIVDLFSSEGIQGANRIFGAIFSPEFGRDIP